jgi:hypothetical protein
MMNKIIPFQKFKVNESSSSDDYRKKIDKLYGFYLKNKNNYDIPEEELPIIDISEDGKEANVSIVKKGEEFHLVISDSDEVDPTPFIAGFSGDREKELTKKEFDDYMKKIKEISDWLDDISQNNLKKKYNVVSDDSFDIEVTESDVTLQQVSDFIASKTQIINKELEFEINYQMHLSAGKNVEKFETAIFVITDIEVRFFHDLLICLLYTKNNFGEPAFILIKESSLTDYIDFENEEMEYDKFEKVIKMYPDLPVMSRKQKRDYERNRKFPFADLYCLTPSNYQSIETLKTITSMLEVFNQSMTDDDEAEDDDED